MGYYSTFREFCYVELGSGGGGESCNQKSQEDLNMAPNTLYITSILCLGDTGAIPLMILMKVPRRNSCSTFGPNNTRHWAMFLMVILKKIYPGNNSLLPVKPQNTPKGIF